MLDEVEAFVRVAEAKSFTGAAKTLGVPKSTLSRAITRLEDRVGTRLLQRTTRAVHVTEAGQRLLDRVGPLVSGLRDALKNTEDESESPEGTLRVTAAPDLGEAFLGEVLPRFLLRCPKVRVEVDLSPRVVSLADEGFDIALRAVPKLEPSQLVARKLGTSEIRLYAAPSYLAAHGTPRTVTEAGAHLRVTLGRIDESAGTGRIAEPARLVAWDFRFIRAVLRAGGGVGPLPEFYARRDVGDGRLVPVVPDWVRSGGHFYLLYAGGKLTPKKVAAFRDFVVPEFQRLLER